MGCALALHHEQSRNTVAMRLRHLGQPRRGSSAMQRPQRNLRLSEVTQTGAPDGRLPIPCRTPIRFPAGPWIG